MKTFSIIANRRQRLRQVDGKPFMLSLVLLWAALAGSGAHADSVDGREIPEFANGSIVLPELAFGLGEWVLFAAIPISVAALATTTARRTVLRALARML